MARGRFAYRAELRDGDRCYGERAEVAQGNPVSRGFSDRPFRVGDERWIAFQIFLPKDFPVGVRTWQSIAQWKQMGSLGTPALNLDVTRGQWRLWNSESSGDSNGKGRLLWRARAVRGRWIKFLLHVRFSPDPREGFVELFGDLADGGGMRRRLARVNTWTMKKAPGSGEAVDSHARIGLYRDPRIKGDAVAYYDGYTVAATRAAAESSAFG